MSFKGLGVLLVFLPLLAVATEKPCTKALRYSRAELWNVSPTKVQAHLPTTADLQATLQQGHPFQILQNLPPLTAQDIAWLHDRLGNGKFHIVPQQDGTLEFFPEGKVQVIPEGNLKTRIHAVIARTQPIIPERAELIDIELRINHRIPPEYIGFHTDAGLIDFGVLDILEGATTYWHAVENSVFHVGANTGVIFSAGSDGALHSPPPDSEAPRVLTRYIYRVPNDRLKF